PLALNPRPECVSSGKTVWQAAHAMPVWRAKLGTAHAGAAAPQSSSRAQNRPGQPGRTNLEEKHEFTASLPRHGSRFCWQPIAGDTHRGTTSLAIRIFT